MRIFHWAFITAVVFTASAVEDKNRGKRQQYFSRRVARPPPYAVQMEPIVQYSQRDPLYNPLASAKSDHDIYQDDNISNYYGNSEPEPIIEIIIKESNESLPTLPAPTTQSPIKSTKEPIQVFYVKYEKKDQGNGKSRVVYDKPIPALSPHEEHEEIKPENSITSVDKEPDSFVTPGPTEPTTTLRAIIRPDSETYHAPVGSGIKVTFGSEKLPPNNHKKRSDREHPTSHPSFLNSFSPASSSVPKKQHGPPFSLPQNHHRPPAFPQQRIVNSFSSQQPQQQQQQQSPHQQLPNQQQLPPQPNYSTLPQFQSLPSVLNGPRPQRLPITIQGLPEIHQRLQFQSFPPHRISINHPQQPGFPPAISVSHQSVHVQNQPPTLNPSNFDRDPVHSHQHQQIQQQSQHHHHHHQQQQQQQLFKHQQESDKQKYHEQKRQQEILKQREQQRQAELQRQEQQRQVELQRQEQHRQAEIQRQQEQQRQAEIQRQQEQQRQAEIQRQQEQQRQAEIQRQEQHFQVRQRYEQLEQQKLKQEKIRQEQQQQHLSQQVEFGNRQPGLLLPSGIQQHNQHQQHQPFYEQQQKPPEILKSVPRLEQHYAIRENPLHPGPFPSSSPKFTPLQYPQNNYSTRQQSNLSVQRQNLVSSSENLSKPSSLSSAELSTPKYQNSQSNTQFLSQHHSIPQQFSSLSQAQSIWGQFKPSIDNKQKIFATPVPKGENVILSSTPRYVSSTTQSPPTTTTTTTTVAPTTPRNEERIKENIANLPDEVPDDIREQLLSSGILGNADIQVLDYDKLGDTPIENLPPEALANFYGAGGGGAVAASAPVPAVAKKPKINRDSKKTTATKVEQATLKPGGVEMKVVHFDPNTAQGQAIADQHIREDATHLKPVTVGAEDDSQYNRYLPLKVSGTSFPIPDVPELKDRKISSVVVLAPVDYNFREDEQSRNSKRIGEAMPVRFLTGETLKQLLKKPSEENFKKWLEQENQTEPQKQSVILFVTTSKHQTNGEKEIYMYDVSSQTVNKLSGDLSSAFVDAAESNSETPDSIDDTSFTP